MSKVNRWLLGVVIFAAGIGFSDRWAHAGDAPPQPIVVTIDLVAPEAPAMNEAVARLARAVKRAGIEMRQERTADAKERGATAVKGPRILLLHERGLEAAKWSRDVGLENWPLGDGYRIKPIPGKTEGPGLVVASRQASGLLYGCHALAEEIERQGTLPFGLDVRSEPRFAVRGWASQLEDFWCRWMGGSPDWFQNDRYLAYLRDAFSRAPSYRINTFSLMGRGEVGELHTFVNYDRWDRLAAHRSPEARLRARQ